MGECFSKGRGKARTAKKVIIRMAKKNVHYHLNLNMKREETMCGSRTLLRLAETGGSKRFARGSQRTATQRRSRMGLEGR